MVSKCANPKCNARLKYLHEGSLFVMPKPNKRYSFNENSFAAPAGTQIECFWLCELCSLHMRISKRGELVSLSAFPAADARCEYSSDQTHLQAMDLWEASL